MPHEHFSPDESHAIQLDAADPLAPFRQRFHLPTGPDGKPLIYFVGNSLGPMPRAARAIIERELIDWATLGVDAHFDAATPWYSYHESLREPLARLVGALPHEVVCMNSLTVNLHLLLATFYRPTGDRFKILMESPAFPSDTYAVRSQIEHHGRNPGDALVCLAPRDGQHTIEQADIESAIRAHAPSLAVVLLGGVNFFTGQVFDIQAITRCAQQHRITVGIDLAHAVGNIPLRLHDWGVDFAVWCSYKYLNAGPGAAAGAFIHERHVKNLNLHRLAGWWGNDPETRFRMHLQPEFVPVPSADAWQLSNPPILSMAPVRASLAIFDDAGGMARLREKSLRLTGYLQFLLDRLPSQRFSVITPRHPEQRGCQLSILAHENPRGLFQSLQAGGVKCDFREPNVIRVAPAPLYNSFHEVWRFARLLAG